MRYRFASLLLVLLVTSAHAQRKQIAPTHADVRYGLHQRNVLDFYQAKGKGPRPLLVYIHGGGWTGGDKRRNRRSVEPFLKRGISYAAINYRLTPQNPLPAPVHDAARAIQFIRSKAKAWNIDKTRVALTGGSAGACTSMWLLLHDDLADPKSSDPIARESTRVTAAAVFGGQTSIDPKVIEPWLGPNVLKHRMINMAVGERTIAAALKKYEQYKRLYVEFSPYNHVTSDDPPLWMSYGNNMKLPSLNAGHGIHHPVYGVKLKEKSDRVGHECHLSINGVSQSSRYQNANQFLFAKLTGEPGVKAVTQLAQQFERAHMSGDAKAMRKLVLPSAMGMVTRGGEARTLYFSLSVAAYFQARAKRKRLAPIRVVSRRVSVYGSSAVVMEVLGALPGVAKGKVKPLRRSTTWVRDGRTWRISHMHTSDYGTWTKAIDRLTRDDKSASPGGVVFVGSSSIRGWRSLQRDFPGHNVLNRGFGGSQLIDCILYAHRIVTPYRPRAVAVYAGDNDMAFGKSPEQVLRDFQALVRTIRSTLPRARIGFIAIKPSLRRLGLWSQMEKANALVSAYAANKPGIDYIDVASPMMTAAGRPRKDLFVDDGLHLNAKGYALWADTVRPWVEKK